MIKVSRNLKEIAVKANACKEIIGKSLGRDPTISELAVELDITKEELIMAMDSQNSVQSLYDVIHQDDGSPITLIDKIQQEESQDIGIIDRIALKEVLSSLESRERQIIIFRYFKEMTQSIEDVLEYPKFKYQE